MLDFLKRKKAEPEKQLTFSSNPNPYIDDDAEDDDSANYTGDGVLVDRALFARTVEKHIGQTGIELEETMLDMLTDYYEIVVRSNANINLTAITEAEDFACKHIIDSLMLAQFLAPSNKKRLIDVGTGAGFPTLPLAITHPDHLFVVIESMNKRYEFVKFACKNVGINNIGINRYRAEEAGHRALFREKFEFATARAVAPLNVLCEYCLPMVKLGGHFLAMKGANYQEELDGAKNAIFQCGGRFEEVREYTLPGGDKRAIIVIKKVVPCRSSVPRRTALIKNKPF